VAQPFDPDAALVLVGGGTVLSAVSARRSFRAAENTGAGSDSRCSGGVRDPAGTRPRDAGQHSGHLYADSVPDGLPGAGWPHCDRQTGLSRDAETRWIASVGAVCTVIFLLISRSYTSYPWSAPMRTIGFTALDTAFAALLAIW